MWSSLRDQLPAITTVSHANKSMNRRGLANVDRREKVFQILSEGARQAGRGARQRTVSLVGDKDSICTKMHSWLTLRFRRECGSNMCSVDYGAANVGVLVVDAR
jgi:hypothetical protein